MAIFIDRSALSAAVAAMLLAGCNVTESQSAATPATLDSRQAHRAAASGAHLYVVDSINGGVYRYELANGLPQTSPDETFTTVPGAKFLGVDEAENVYAAGSSGSTGFVEEFSPDGTSQGTAELNVAVAAFAVDRDGYLYVVPSDDGGKVYTYAPSSIGLGSVAQPVAILTGKAGSGFYTTAPGLTIAGKGPLYQASFSWINVFNHPRKTSREDSTIRRPRLSLRPQFSGALALDSSAQLYANVGFLDSCEGRKRSCRPYDWYLTDFDAISGGPGHRRDRMIRSRNCYYAGNGGAMPGRPLGPPSSYYYRSSGVVTGMAVYGGYVDAACSGDESAVWVYRASDFTHQKPVEKLRGTSLPTDAKIGP